MPKINKNKSSGNYFWIAVGIILLDQITKYCIRTNLSIGESLPLIKNFFAITFLTNTGAAFSMLQGANYALFFFSLVVLGLFLFYWQTFSKTEKPFVAIIIAGIIGNGLDRIIFGYVIDFIHFSFWPAFNVADSAITIGIIGLILIELKK